MQRLGVSLPCKRSLPACSTQHATPGLEGLVLAFSFLSASMPDNVLHADSQGNQDSGPKAQPQIGVLELSTSLLIGVCSEALCLPCRTGRSDEGRSQDLIGNELPPSLLAVRSHISQLMQTSRGTSTSAAHSIASCRLQCPGRQPTMLMHHPPMVIGPSVKPAPIQAANLDRSGDHGQCISPVPLGLLSADAGSFLDQCIVGAQQINPRQQGLCMVKDILPCVCHQSPTSSRTGSHQGQQLWLIPASCPSHALSHHPISLLSAPACQGSSMANRPMRTLNLAPDCIPSLGATKHRCSPAHGPCSFVGMQPVSSARPPALHGCQPSRLTALAARRAPARPRSSRAPCPRGPGSSWWPCAPRASSWARWPASPRLPCAVRLCAPRGPCACAWSPASCCPTAWSASPR